MTQVQAMKMQAGDTFKRPSTNGHCPSGFRRYEVMYNDHLAMGFIDEFGYTSSILWGKKNGTDEFLKTAIITKVTQ
jgi:hypothetical protein